MLEYRNKKDALYTLEMNVLEVETAISKTKKKKEYYVCCERTVYLWYIVRERRNRGEKVSYL